MPRYTFAYGKADIEANLKLEDFETLLQCAIDKPNSNGITFMSDANPVIKVLKQEDLKKLLEDGRESNFSFDHILLSLWNEAQQVPNLFRYKHKPLETKFLGEHHFLAQVMQNSVTIYLFTVSQLFLEFSLQSKGK